MRTWNRKATLRWAAPLVAAGLVIGGGIAVSQPAAADNDLPDRSPAQLLSDIQRAETAGISGTVRQTAELGLPDLPGMGGEDSSDLSSLVSGTHTLRVWSAGADKSRVALLGRMGESDIVRNGDEVWVWSSGDKTARHYTAPKGGAARKAPAAPSDLPSTPQEAADAALQALDPSTEVTVAKDDTVAGRAVYELVLTPRDDASKVASVRIAIDGKEHLPLRVQVLADNATKPAIEVGFTSVDFSRPAAERFEFTPPKGSTVTEVLPSEPGDPNLHKATYDGDHKIVGKGWASVVVASMPSGEKSTDGDKTGDAGQLGELQGMLASLPKVSGSWGSGRLLDGPLFSVVVTDDGRIAAGAVAPAALYSALNAK
jgi:outer membrane lipoprotein-sorting protein